MLIFCITFRSLLSSIMTCKVAQSGFPGGLPSRHGANPDLLCYWCLFIYPDLSTASLRLTSYTHIQAHNKSNKNRKKMPRVFLTWPRCHTRAACSLHPHGNATPADDIQGRWAPNSHPSLLLWDLQVYYRPCVAKLALCNTGNDGVYCLNGQINHCLLAYRKSSV